MLTVPDVSESSSQLRVTPDQAHISAHTSFLCLTFRIRSDLIRHSPSIFFFPYCSSPFYLLATDISTRLCRTPPALPHIGLTSASLHLAHLSLHHAAHTAQLITLPHDRERDAPELPTDGRADSNRLDSRLATRHPGSVCTVYVERGYPAPAAVYPYHRVDAFLPPDSDITLSISSAFFPPHFILPSRHSSNRIDSSQPHPPLPLPHTAPASSLASFSSTLSPSPPAAAPPRPCSFSPIPLAGQTSFGRCRSRTTSGVMRLCMGRGMLYPLSCLLSRTSSFFLNINGHPSLQARSLAWLPSSLILALL